MSRSTERITQINDNDIICGRKGVALKHPGNLAYRKIVGLNKELYVTCLKSEKLRVSKNIVAAMREVGGRFIEREDGKTSTAHDEQDEEGNPVAWRDIGDKRAVEKTSQALREGQPQLLKQLAQNAQNQNRHQHHISVPLQEQHYQAALLNPSIATHNYQFNPYPYATQTVPPPPAPLLPHLLAQLETSDLLLLAILADRK